MKKSFGFIFLAIMFSFIAVFVPPKTKEHASAANVRKSVKLEFQIAENKNEDEFSVRVYLNENPGICELSMELSYDAESMMLASYTKGSALEKMELDTPEDEKPDGYAHTPFTFKYSGKKDSDFGIKTYENDTTTGVLFLMRFKLRAGAADKEYKVTFINVEAGYYDSQTLSVEKCATATEEVKVQVVGGKVSTLNISDKVDESSVKLRIILLSIVGGLVIVLAIVGLSIYLAKHKNIFARKQKIKKANRIAKKEEQKNTEEPEKEKKPKKPINYKELNRSTKVKKKIKNSRIKKK